MFTPKRFFAWRCAWVRARWSTHTSTSMGSSDTDVKALAVMPCTSFSESSVITVMPVAKQASALRNSAWLTLILQNPRAVGAELVHWIRYHGAGAPLGGSCRLLSCIIVLPGLIRGESTCHREMTHLEPRH